MTGLALLSLLIWVYLLGFHGRFWQAGPVLGASRPNRLPAVAIVVPARDEASVIEATLRSLLAQDYAGRLQVCLVDDNSQDQTAVRARALLDPRLTVVDGAPRPAGWSGKLWAIRQGVDYTDSAELIFLTDADIMHQPAHLSSLVAQLERADLDMVSEMVALACDSWAERLLVPAFVFFFQLLYPFAWVNDPMRSVAAAAGGSVLIRRSALQRIGGIDSLKGALIDDVTLARRVKQGGRIWLGHSVMARSVRPYPAVSDIWSMITRTAFVQLRYSLGLLILTTLAMAVVWLVPPFFGLFGHGVDFAAGALAWAMLTISYLPTLSRFGRSCAWAILLPLIALFYMAATIGSAINYYAGRGVAWKGRAYKERVG